MFKDIPKGKASRPQAGGLSLSFTGVLGSGLLGDLTASGTGTGRATRSASVSSVDLPQGQHGKRSKSINSFVVDPDKFLCDEEHMSQLKVRSSRLVC
jgi:hypothetical protein